MLSYSELEVLIAKMTDEQKNKPVLFYSVEDGELHPEEKSRWPQYKFTSRLVPVTTIPGFKDRGDSNQYVIEPYMNEKDSLECEKLHWLEVLQKGHPDSQIQQSREDRLQYIEDQLSKWD